MKSTNTPARLSRVVLIGLAALVASLMGCAKPEQVSCGTGDITANPWELKSYGTPAKLTLPLPGTQITLNFMAGGTTIGGNDGCNAYFGGCQIDTKTCGLKIDQSISTTKKACEPAIGQQEQKYLDLLKAAQRYTISSGGLRIICGKEEMNFVPYVETQ